MTQTEPVATATPSRSHPAAAFRRARVIDLLRSTTARNQWDALVLLAIGLIITVLAVIFIKADVEANAQREFDFTCNEIRLNIDARLVACAQTLLSGAALFDASETVTREEWRAFTQGLELEQQLPGIQGIGFAMLIPRAQLAQHVQEIRREGFPDYQVRPAGERDTYSAIIYLEPFSDRNLRAFGYDMLSESVRRVAMERARDEHKAAISGKVILVQETGQDVQAGTLMYVPVYRHGLPLETIAQRRAAIQGWVYSPYRMTNLLRDTLRGWDVKQTDRQIVLQIYDGDVVSAETLLYDSRHAKDQTRASTARTTGLIPLDFAGRRWTLRFSQLGGLASMADYDRVWLVLGGGTTISLLLFGMTLSLLNTRATAVRMAGQLSKRLTLATRAGGVGIWEHDFVNNTLVWDKQMFRLYGITPDKFGSVYAAWLEGVHPEDVQRGDEEVQRALRGEQEFDTEFRVRWPDGTIRNIRALALVQRDAAGQPTHMIGTNWDITEHKRAEEALRQSSQEVQKINVELERFLYTASHDLKSPVVTVRTFLGYLEQDLADAQAERVAKDLFFIRAAADKMVQLLDDLLEFSRIGRVLNPPVSVTLRDLADETLRVVAGRIAERGVTVQVGDHDVTLYGDRLRLAEIWQNLVENAAKFMGGQPEPRVEIGVETRGAETVFFVRDNGIGIDPRFQEKLFGLFEKLDPKAEGTGLGLALVKRIVELYQGRIWVESPGPGQGACFYFTLPRAINKEPKEGEEA